MSVFTSPEFWSALKTSGSIGEDRGMFQHTFNSNDSTLHSFSKTHSYGEYIFDWSWAQAFEQHGIPYYPKLLSMIPFTPATTPHFWGPDSDWPELLRHFEQLLPQHSSAHFLFTTAEENKFLAENGYMLRDSFQYHFLNENYSNFRDFLSSLKTKKAKNIRKEREFNEIKIEQLTGEDLKPSHADEMYSFYRSTLQDKKAIPYLTQTFFEMAFRTLPNNVLYVRAESKGEACAGALFFYDKECLYGRYWGCNTDIQNLHFEICYYQGIEFCIQQKLKKFEAGAQGEHKIARGFRPVLTSSAHKINHAGFSAAISNYIIQERKQIALSFNELNQLLPFKN